MLAIDEARHLNEGPRPGEWHAGAGLAVVTGSVDGEPAAEVLQRAKEVMRRVIEVDASDWPTEEQWAERLPGWFVQACPPEQTEQEQQDWLAWWRSLDAAARAEAEARQPWSLGEWLHWLQPDERQWFWWDDGVMDGPEADVRVTVEVPGWPAPIAALTWLLRASGASSLTVEEDLA